MRKRVAIGIGGIALLMMAGAWLFQAQIGAWLFNRVADQQVGRNNLSGLADGLHLGLCGTGSPMPNAARAGPCNIVIAGNQLWVVDVGEGGNRNINLMGFSPADIEGVLLTHFHSDHIDGLGPLMLYHWTRGASENPLPVYGPEGVRALVAGFNAAYATDETYRIAHHGETVVPRGGGGGEARTFRMTGDRLQVLRRGGVTITAFTVDHDPVEPAVGYRFDYKGRAICISGDTAKSANLEKVCNGVDIIVHDALQPAMVKEMQAALEARGNANAAKIMFDIQDYHASPEDAAESAQAADAKMLVLSHLVPPLPMAYLYPAFLGDAENRFDGEIVVGEDGMFFTLPAEGGEIERDELM